MDCCLAVVSLAIVVLILYKILDHLVRIPYIGDYGSRYILVTGCDSGFGNLLARRLDQLGCHVFAGCLTEKGETELRKVSSNRLHTISLDVTKHENVCKALDYVKAKLPKDKGLWGVMNNAGVLSYYGPCDWLTVEEFKDQCDVNLWGLIDVTLTFLPLVKKEKGRVVNTSSIVGRFAPDYATGYSISKYGVEAFTDGLRRNLRVYGCKALLIEPGSHGTQLMSSENIERIYHKALEKSSPEVRADYGIDYINGLLKRRPSFWFLRPSERTADVVAAYHHALLGRFPRARYLVGIDAKYVYIPIQFLPEWLGDLLSERLYSEMPIPASLMKPK